jgi:surfeit locus 1 family protein
MPIHFVPTYLKNNIISHLVVLCAFSLLFSLGIWQYKRWDFKERLLELEQNQSLQQPINSQQLLNLDNHATLTFRKVELVGNSLPDINLLLDNQIHQGQAGYDVLSVLQLNDKTGILVNRGWVPQQKTRQILPKITELPSSYKAIGTLRTYSKSVFLKTPYESETVSWPLRVQYLDFNSLSQILGLKIIEQVVVLEKNQTGSFVAKPNLQSWLTPERHLGYSMQWFGLSICLLIIYIIVLRKKG